MPESHTPCKRTHQSKAQTQYADHALATTTLAIDEALPPEAAARLIRKIKESQSCSVYTDLDQAVQGIASLIIPGRVEARAESERSQEAKNSRIREL